MEFQWENRTGPVDCASPFAQVGQHQSMRKNPPPMSPLKSPSKKRAFGDSLNNEQAGSRSAQTRVERSSTRHLPTSPDKQLPPTPFSGTPAFSGLFTTPHKNQNTYDDSSAGETPRSPENNDSDATPDTNMRSAMARFDHASQPVIAGAERSYGSPSPSKEVARPGMPHRESSLQRAITGMKNIKNKLSSPGRNESRSEHRVEKRRRGQVDRKFARQRRRSMSDSGEDSDRPPRTSSPRKTGKLDRPSNVDSKQHWIASFFTFIAQHPTVPHILSFYAQLLFNVALLGSCLYLIYCFWSAVQGDVEKRSWEAQIVVMAEMAACAEQYNANKCDPTTRVRALEALCENWALCMKQDPSKVKRAQVGAQTFAEIFNAFVEAISYKAMAFTFILVFGCFAISNLAFGYFRDKASAPQFHQQQYYPPPTPQRSFSGQGGQDFYGTPWHQHQSLMASDPQPSDGFGQIEGRGSPVKRLDYR